MGFCCYVIEEGSLTSTFEDGSDFTGENIKVAVRVYERYSVFGGNRVSLNLTLIGDSEKLHLTAITSGGSQAVFNKLNTIGEESFLNALTDALDSRYGQL